MTRLQKNEKTSKMKKMKKNIKQKKCFLQNSKKLEMKLFAFWVITFEPNMIQTCTVPQNDHWNLSFVKDTHVIGEKLLERVVKQPFISRKFW